MFNSIYIYLFYNNFNQKLFNENNLLIANLLLLAMTAIKVGCKEFSLISNFMRKQIIVYLKQI